jgi:hypothetical protein
MNWRVVGISFLGTTEQLLHMRKGTDAEWEKRETDRWREGGVEGRKREGPADLAV